MCFPYFCHCKYNKQITPLLQWVFLMVCTFSYGHLFLVSIFYHLTFEKNQVHIGNLTNCRKILLLIKFYLNKKRGGQQRKLTSTIQVSLLKYTVVFLLSCGRLSLQFTSFCCLLFICLFAFLTTTNFCCQRMQGAYKMCSY